MNVKDKVIAVTGGAGGIGTAQTKLLAEHGARVWVLDLAGERANALAAELTAAGREVRALQMDVASEEDWKAAVDRIVAESGRLDVVVNNAGINIRKPIEEMMKAEWMQMMEVNTASVFLATKYAIPVMRRQGGGEP